MALKRSISCRISVSVILIAVCIHFAAIERANAEDDGVYLISNAGSSSLSVMVPERQVVVQVVKNGSGLAHPDAILPHLNQRFMLVSSGLTENDSAILKFDMSLGRIIGRFDDGKGPLHRPYGMTWSPSQELYVSSFFTDTILRYDSEGRYLGHLPKWCRLHGPNALHFAKDGYLYATTEGSKAENGTVTWPYQSQVVRMRDGVWEIFVKDASPFSSPNAYAGPNFLGLASSPVDDHLIFVSDYSNGILAFDLHSGMFQGRVETSFTGIPSKNSLGAIAFNTDPKRRWIYDIYAPAFLPSEDNLGLVLRAQFNSTDSMKSTPISVAVQLTQSLIKPISITRIPNLR